LRADGQNHERDRLSTAINFLRGERESTPDELQRHIDPFLESPSMALRLMPTLADDSFPSRIRDAVVARAMKSEQPELRDLFERFLPEEQRVKRLGAIVKPEQILAIPGDVERGRKLFFEVQGVQCKNCHRIGGKGQEVGPDLDGIGKKY